MAFIAFPASVLCLHLAAIPPTNLAPNPSFEDTQHGIIGWYPVGIVTDGVDPLELTEQVSHTGGRALLVNVGPIGSTSGTVHYSSYNAGEATRQESGQDGVRGVRTIAYRLDQDVRQFQASVWVHAEDTSPVQAQIRWYARLGRKRPVELMHVDSTATVTDQSNGWARYEVAAIRPQGSHQAQLWIETAGSSPFLIDDVHILLPRAESVQILVDQLGYVPKSQTKQILLQSSIPLHELAPTFRVVDLSSLSAVYEGEWTSLGYHAAFDRHYWRGDINALDEQGSYVVETRHGRETVASASFDICDGLMAQTTRLAYEFFYYQRCGMEIPGFHKACHLDDARMPGGSHRNLVGGWHDAGDYNKYNAGYTPESVYALALTYSRNPALFDAFDRDSDGVCDVLDEARWGAEYLVKCLDTESYQCITNVSTGYGYWGKPESETDNVPNEDDRPVTDGWIRPNYLVGSLALVGLFTEERYIELAEDVYRHNGGNFHDLLALYQATGKPSYRDELRVQVTALLAQDDGGLGAFRELAEYVLVQPSADEVAAIRQLAEPKCKEIRAACDAYFGVRQYRAGDENYYFRAYREVNDWYVGDSREMLELAYTALLVERLGCPQARQLAEDQWHWVFGRNPFGVSLMEGIGKRFIPSYHHRYNMIPGNPRGAVPGAIVNGITRSWPWADRPWLDMNPVPNGDFQPNEPWLPHNIKALYVLSLW